METMGILGFIFGMSGLSFAIIAWGQLAGLRKEFEELKKNIEDTGILKKQAKPENN